MARTRFAIVCQGRTGSTLLADLLNSHPQIESKGELFHPNLPPEDTFAGHPDVSKRDYLERYAFTTQKPIRGFKSPIEWLHIFPGVYDLFREQGYRIIRLNRASPLAHYVSAVLASANQDWTSRQAYRKQTVRIEPWSFISFTIMRNQWSAAMDRLCEGLPIHPVTYEKLLEPESQRAILEFLGADPEFALSADRVRARTVALQDAIENYDELSAVVAATPYARLVPPRPASSA